MKRLSILTPIVMTLAASAASILAVPAAAQDEAGDKVDMKIIYGDDKCPESTADTITVCARKAESERYRIPENLRTSDDPQNKAWAERVESFEMAGAFGAMSCSPTGAAGFTGCTQQMIKAAYGEKSESSNIRFAELIAAARAQRLSTIDADAAATQKRVEVLEQEYLDKLKKERDGENAGSNQKAVQQPSASSSQPPAEQQPGPGQ